MGQILRNWRVTLATLFAAVLVIGAFMLARGIESPSLAQASAETALLQAIATKDSDGDGLPDWEEVLYGTDANMVDTFTLGMTDGDAVAKGLVVPKAIADISIETSTSKAKSDIDYAAQGVTAPTEGTLTDVFAKNIFSRYLAAKQANGGTNLSVADTREIVHQALTSLSSAVIAALDFKSVSALPISGSGVEAFKSFAAHAETVMRSNTADATTSEIIYLQYAVEHNDDDALVHIASIAKAYRDTAAGLAALSVPSELAGHDLALINSLMHVSEIISDFARVNVDPLATMLALQQYVPAAQALGAAFTAISNEYTAAGVVLPEGTPGAAFVHMVKTP